MVSHNFLSRKRAAVRLSPMKSATEVFLSRMWMCVGAEGVCVCVCACRKWMA